MRLTLEYEQEEDGRWLGEVPQLPGILTYGVSVSDAVVKAESLALQIMAEQLENREAKPVEINLLLPACA